ncbi:hypothetical protein UWK_02944 [Desulfocapsa sulfexigens DSM 10523]|uniref:Uncharacterized protein n=1 Tax=Desulfocapsa sulfexigens (strain DSM 10523 / SB164P1) TaxID=1167006 RepID=M1NIW6_DESSD|nr:hypothetical protein [Desulfocapsa sulfexigens]AGF79474.1 hypothetical protein UWK_02944 [Desulfocapsa sulfexigens DSM 10523]
MVTLTTVNRLDYSIEIDQKWSNYKEELTEEHLDISIGFHKLRNT